MKGIKNNKEPWLIKEDKEINSPTIKYFKFSFFIRRLIRYAEEIKNKQYSSENSLMYQTLLVNKINKMEDIKLFNILFSVRIKTIKNIFSETK
tara:strand:+ start:427 stop:705 length:279 start_codon:yes stop_codon:yes gene_type:complete